MFGSIANPNNMVGRFIILILQSRTGMGNSNNNNQQALPEEGYRIIGLSSPEARLKLNLMTDYIVSPKINAIKLEDRPHLVQLKIFSVLDYSLKDISISLPGRQLGFGVRFTRVNDCVLRITKVFAQSPCQTMGVLVNQYIVGVLEGEYYSLKSFAELLRVVIAEGRPFVTLGVCNQQGVTRMVIFTVAILGEWRKKQKGVLGCELAEGWIHRFKGFKPKREPIDQIHQPQSKQDQNQSSGISAQALQTKAGQLRTDSSQPLKKFQRRANTDILIPRGHSSEQQINSAKSAKSIKDLYKAEQVYQIEHETLSRSPQKINSNPNIGNGCNQSSCSSEDIETKCAALENSGDFFEINYKGVLKNQVIDDASAICKCKPLNRHCEKCFLENKKHFYFFNKKTSRIIAIDANMLLD